MSQYHEVEILMDDKECLVKALQELGYQPVVNEKAVSLYGYQGDRREQKAHIVIPRKQVSSASNDVGFEKQANGKYVMHLSEYDANVFKTNKLKQFYTKHKLTKFVKQNAGKYSFKSTKVEKDGTIKIRIQRF